MPIKALVYINTQKELLHSYPDAPDDVLFLKTPHRHMFHFKVAVEVDRNNREVEFIQLKRFVDQNVLTQLPEESTMSCEDMADFIADAVSSRYPDKQLMVEVSEDGENGVIKHYPYSSNK